MYPDKSTCEKRMRMIELQLESLIPEQEKVCNYIKSLEHEKETLKAIIQVGENNARDSPSSQ